MSFLLINLVVLAVVAAAGVLAYAQMLRRSETDEWMASAPGIDYAALQAHWRGLAAARDWDSLRAQVRRWHEAGASDAGAVDCEEVAYHLNRAVFRFAVPGEPLALGRTTVDGLATRLRAGAARCPARLRARSRS